MSGKVLVFGLLFVPWKLIVCWCVRASRVMGVAIIMLRIAA